ncbi:unnamed protein product [Ilex paraguariensis]|uniref:Uncharacterized protein n=1 Tax=Ilex paraguariensis TaxID=185542 RepID=A0ABC8S891_9AQUA
MAASPKTMNSTSLIIITLLLFLQFFKIKALVDEHICCITTGLRSKDVILVKIWCLIILFFSTFFVGFSPYFFRKNESFLVLGTQFAGGVFLGTSLMHFLGDTISLFDYLGMKEYFPVMLASVGYLLALLGDCKVVYGKKDGGGEAEPEVGRGRMAAEEGGKEMGVDVSRGLMEEASFRTFRYTVFILLALCCNSVFEGIVVGVAGNKRTAWRNMWVIALHRTFAAIAMGITVLRLKPKRPFLTTVAYSFGLAISTPVGVGIGIAINSTTQGHLADWINVVSMGLASGVLNYIAMNDIILKSFKPQQARCKYDTPFYKFVAVLVGVVVMAVVLVFQ